jgi:hypothetical protein
MQVQIMKAQRDETRARPASGSAFLAGHPVTVTIPTMAISNGLLAIGDEWTELRFSNGGNQMRALAQSTPHATDD